MSSSSTSHTLEFDAFWEWLVLHPNCILRAGTFQAVLYDDEDLHWQFAAEESALYVQIIRGKRLMGELMIEPEPISYVQLQESDREGEWIFELITENHHERYPAYFFVLSHGYDEVDEVPGGRAVH